MKSEDKTGGQCGDEARLLKFSGEFRWHGLPPDGYGGVKGDDDPNGAYKAAQRFTIFGDDCAVAFHQRYFELGPGGWSRLEKHEHSHCVIVMRGRATLVLGGQLHEIVPYDAVYIAPRVEHQLITIGEEPFGFLCTVDAERDEPVQLEGRALAEYQARFPHLLGVIRPFPTRASS